MTQTHASERGGAAFDDDEPLSSRVVSAVAAARGVDATELPPLYEAIDPDALNRLFQPAAAEDRRGPGRIVFEVADCDVEVQSGGAITVTPMRTRSDDRQDVDPSE
ncbi:hypothetical protein BRC82_00495 [Halobacteriales archaeon QS_1_67_19]|nr:MAG: hypothetical protein BRC82_00495 [Halobacteriales archaeon QS_1_67_19]